MIFFGIVFVLYFLKLSGTSGLLGYFLTVFMVFSEMSFSEDLRRVETRQLIIHIDCGSLLTFLFCSD